MSDAQANIAIAEARAKIVTALNLTPLVPPQADIPTVTIVNDAWNGLSDIMTELSRLRAENTDLRGRCTRVRNTSVFYALRAETFEEAKKHLQNARAELGS